MIPCTGTDGRAWPRSRPVTGAPCPSGSRWRSAANSTALELVASQLAAVERERDALVAQTAEADARAAPAALIRLRGIGPELAALLWLEALFRRFENRRQIAAYAGLTPSPWKSGGIDREQGIAKSGNPRLRRAMIELAWFWVRHQPGSALSRWFVERVGAARGLVRRIAIVALARKLLVALWRYVTQGVVPEGAMLKG
jgi:transposase